MKRTIITAVVVAVATFSAGYAYGHRGSLPACVTEDSPSCVWTDPDTGVEYVNGYDAGMSICERSGLLCDES